MLNVYYIAEIDITIIFEDSYDKGEHVSTEIVGFYFGEPDEHLTELNANRVLLCRFE